MKVVNLFGGPSAGKSTAFLGLSFELKRRGLRFEGVDEYAKELVWEDRHNTLADQLYILAKQNRKLLRLRGKVDIVVNEAPIINGLTYTPEGYYAAFAPLVREVWNSYDNVSFFIERRFPYRTEGRIQDEAGARAIDERVKALLAAEGVSYRSVGADVAVEAILEALDIPALLARGATDGRSEK